MPTLPRLRRGLAVSPGYLLVACTLAGDMRQTPFPGPLYAFYGTLGCGADLPLTDAHHSSTVENHCGICAFVFAMAILIRVAPRRDRNLYLRLVSRQLC